LKKPVKNGLGKIIFQKTVFLTLPEVKYCALATAGKRLSFMALPEHNRRRLNLFLDKVRNLH
jgi:hypothetical protein